MYREGVIVHVDGKYWVPGRGATSPSDPAGSTTPARTTRCATPENLLEDLLRSRWDGGPRSCSTSPPTRRGRIHENDIASLQGFKAIRDATFKTDLARGAAVSASNVRGNAAAFAAGNVIDGDRAHYWATDDGVVEASLTIDFGAKKTFDHVVLQEYIELGQRILRLSVEAHQDGTWNKVADATSIGWKRILRTEAVTADKVRVNILEAKVCPALSTVALYAGPPQVAISPDTGGFMDATQVELHATPRNAAVHYTLDGSTPTQQSPAYDGPFTIDKTTAVRAVGYVGDTPSMAVAERTLKKLEEDDFLDPVVVENLLRGLHFTYYEGGWQSLNDMAGAQPAAEGRARDFDLRYRKRDEHCALRFEGYIDIPEKGVWEFATASDDGSNLYIGDVRIVANDYLQAPTERSGRISLKKGLHPIRVDYFNATGDAHLSVLWTHPDGTKEPIPARVLRWTK